jgi:hypothetical protein
MAADPWLVSLLVQRGVMSESGLSRTAKMLECRDCKSHVIAGLDADRCAREAVCDPLALSKQGEALALIAGRSTWHLLAGRLEYRDHWRILGYPAGSVNRPVVASHLCHHQIPSDWAAPAPITPLRTHTEGLLF